MKRVFSGIVKTLVLAALLALTALLAWAFESRSLPALQVWHTPLGSEFTVQDATPRSTLQDYLDQETRLFAELRDKIYQRVERTDPLIYNRYHKERRLRRDSRETHRGQGTAPKRDRYYRRISRNIGFYGNESCRLSIQDGYLSA